TMYIGDWSSDVCYSDLDLDIGVLRQEFRELRPEDRVDGVVTGRDPEGPGGPIPQLVERHDRGLDFRDMRPDRLEQPFARLGRRDAARGSGKKPEAESGLEAADRLAQRRLRHAELRSGAGEIPLAGDREKRSQIVQVLSGHS